MANPTADTRPERILDLTARLHAVAGVKIGEITTVNRQAKMLSMNAMVVAARAGDAGIRNLQRHGLVRLPDPKQGRPCPLTVPLGRRAPMGRAAGKLAAFDTIDIVMISTHIGVA